MAEKQVVKTNSCEETEKFSEGWGRTLVGGETILLKGDLGAGKTHFVKGLARALGVTDVVTSPTFALHNVYYGAKLTLNHFDFYRIDDSAEVEMLGLVDFFCEKDAVSAIEWSENVADLLPKNVVIVSIAKLSDNAREITIEKTQNQTVRK